MRYSTRLQRSSPSMKRPGNVDSGMATEYSAEGQERGKVRADSPGAQQCLVAPEVLSHGPVTLGAAALCPAAMGPSPTIRAFESKWEGCCDDLCWA